MLLDQSTLCKPLVQRELLFYLNIPRELQEYVPNYKGKKAETEKKGNILTNTSVYHFCRRR